MAAAQLSDNLCFEETGRFQLQQHSIFYRVWRPQNHKDIQLVIHINHGMAEHSGRYQGFAQACVRRNIAVIAQDHLGYGESSSSHDDLGHIANIHSFTVLLKATAATQTLCSQLFPNIPVVLFGHSMGSFITLGYLEDEQKKTNSPKLQAVVLSGSTQNPWYLDKSLKIVARLERLRQGKKGKSSLINLLTFGQFNRQFKPSRTTADWLSRDPRAVDIYLSDPLCGELSSNQTWFDFAQGLLDIFRRFNLKKLPNQVPFLVISGDQDPLSDRGGLHRLEQSLIAAGVSVQVTTFPHGRHELLNELNHHEVESYVFDWIELIATPGTPS